MASSGQFLNSPHSDARVVVALPVTVISNEIGVAPQRSCTFEVSRNSVRLQHVDGVHEAGQEIWIKRHHHQARYRVAWIGQPETAEAGQFAADCLEEIVIWDAEVIHQLK